MALIEDTSLKLLNSMLGGLVKKGSLTIIDHQGNAHVHGDGGDPKATLQLHDPKLYRAIFINPELVAGEAYMDETLTFDGGSIRDLLKVFHVNSRNLRGKPFRKAMAKAVKSVRRFQQNNSLARARAHVAHHYDLSNDFYRLFLDDDMNYSCAYFTEDGQSLEAAQKAKLRHIAAKLKIEPGMRVLDIGCGWGGMAIYLAEHFDADVTGVTLSKEQQALAIERAKARGVKDRVEIRLTDYRQVQESFDRIVSIGMFEHVGAPYYDVFFEKLFDLLADDGLALLHSIGTRNEPGVTGPWIRKYIFPGGYSPALSETFASIERSGLWVTDTEILRLHYAETLGEWERRFQANRAKVSELFDERFCRMWEFYLSTAEFAFRFGGHMNFQIQLAKSVDAAPLHRDYMRKTEKALRSKDGG